MQFRKQTKGKKDTPLRQALVLTREEQTFISVVTDISLVHSWGSDKQVRTLKGSLCEGSQSPLIKGLRDRAGSYKASFPLTVYEDEL